LAVKETPKYKWTRHLFIYSGPFRLGLLIITLPSHILGFPWSWFFYLGLYFSLSLVFCFSYFRHILVKIGKGKRNSDKRKNRKIGPENQDERGKY